MYIVEKAIDNYNTYNSNNIKADVVNIYIGKEKAGRLLGLKEPLGTKQVTLSF